MNLEIERLEQITAQLKAIEAELTVSGFASNPEFRDAMMTARAKVSSAHDILGWTLRFTDPDAVETRRPRAQVPQIVRS